MIAAGTVIASDSPHRFVRNERRHTAPPSGQTIALLSEDTCRGDRPAPSDARSGVESITSTAIRQPFPSVPSFPRWTPPLWSQFCSLVSIVLRIHLNSRRSSCQHCPPRGSLASQGVNRQAALHLRLMGSPAPFSEERRCAWNAHACTGSLTPPCPSMPRHRRQRRCGLLPLRAGSAHGSGARDQLENRELNGWPALPFSRTLKTVRSPGPPPAEGRSSWLNFPRKILSFSIPNRFCPGTPEYLFSSLFLSLNPSMTGIGARHL